MTIETKELVISEELKRKVEMICRFAYVDYEFINGNIKSIKNTNIAYVKPHILKVKNSDNEHISIKEFKKITRKLDNRLEQQNYLMTRDFEELQEKLKTSKPTITGKEVKIDKDTYDTLNNFMNTSKRVIKDIPRNQALFKELTDYTQTYKDLENEKRNIQYEVKRLEYKNKELQQENNKLKSLLNIIVQSLKQFFRKLLKLGNENDKDKVVEEITSYHKLDLYTNKDLHDIADNTTREDEINDYLYTKNYEKDDRDFDI